MTEKELRKVRRKDFIESMLAKDKMNNDLQARLDTVTAELQEMKEANGQLKTSLDEKDGQIEELQRRLDEKEAAMDALQKEQEELRASLNEKVKEWEESEADVARLKAELNEKDTTIAMYEGRVSETEEMLRLIRTELEQTQATGEHLKAMMDERDGMVEIYKGRLDEKDATIEILRAELEEQRASRRIELETAGSIAAASLHLNGVFEAAQKAADQYLYNIKKMYEERCAVMDVDPAEVIEAVPEEGEKAEQSNTEQTSVEPGSKDGSKVKAPEAEKAAELKKTQPKAESVSQKKLDHKIGITDVRKLVPKVSASGLISSRQNEIQKFLGNLRGTKNTKRRK